MGIGLRGGIGSFFGAFLVMDCPHSITDPQGTLFTFLFAADSNR